MRSDRWVVGFVPRGGLDEVEFHDLGVSRKGIPGIPEDTGLKGYS